MRVLVVNAGSSTLKLGVVGPDDDVTAETVLPADGGRFDEAELARWLSTVGEVDAAGHRVVHGGERFTRPVLLTTEVEDAIVALAELAPLHQPAAVAGIAAVRRARPDLPAVACFDTAFHATLAPAAATYALPPEWRAQWPLRRYGFHGLSHAWAARRAAELSGRPEADLRTVTCHLGAGASLAAVAGGRCTATTMGFTPLEGLVMATRSGSVDPGLVLWLIEHGGLAPAEVADGLEHRSGLAGLAGEADMRKVVAGAAGGDERAVLALAVYVRSVAAHAAAMATSLGGLDALVFTGGVGENAPAVRAAVAARLAWAGVTLDPVANDSDPDAEISPPGAAVRAFVVAAREDLEIANGVRALLG